MCFAAETVNKPQQERFWDLKNTRIYFQNNFTPSAGSVLNTNPMLQSIAPVSRENTENNSTNSDNTYQESVLFETTDMGF